MNWIVVSDWKDIPEGMWLVKTDKSHSSYQVAYSHPNMTIVGNHFYFDAGNPIAYTAFEGYQN